MERPPRRDRSGGRAYPIVHAGSFRTLREARTRRDLVGGEIAAGRNPAEVLRAMVEQPRARTLGQWAEAYRTSRVDVSKATLKNVRSHLGALAPLADRDPATITTSEEWLATLRLKTASVRKYVQTFRAVLDFAGVDPNPAKPVRLPREERAEVDPPSAAEAETIIATATPKWRLPLRVLAETGMRVGELHALAWADVDESGSRFRVRKGKTAAARRWVAVPKDLMREVAETCPREDRTAERVVFPGCAPVAVWNAMARACTDAGIAHRHPHDLRHASVQIARGVPVTAVAAQPGHSRKSLTLDTYAHVLLDD